MRVLCTPTLAWGAEVGGKAAYLVDFEQRAPPRKDGGVPGVDDHGVLQDTGRGFSRHTGLRDAERSERQRHAGPCAEHDATRPPPLPARGPIVTM